MGRDQEYPRPVQGLVLVVETLVELDQFDHEAVVRTGDGPLLLDEGLCLFVVVAVLEDDVGDNEGDGSRDALNAVDEDVLLPLLAVLDQVYHPVKQALDVFVLGVLKKQC